MSESPAARRPWWGRILFFYVTTPEGVTDRHWFLLGVLGATLLIAGYDLGILNLALPQIQEGLGVEEAELGALLGIVRLGVLPAFLLAFLADRAGRRLLLILTILGFTVFTVASAFAQTAEQFVAAQFLARCFMAAEEMIAIVVIAEELGSKNRGWALGIVSALGTLGHGLAGVVFSGVEYYPYGWRALYIVGVIPLLMLAWIRRGVRETERYERVTAGNETPTLSERVRPLVELASAYPGRMLALAAATAPFSFVVFTALSFAPKTLQETHGWSPGGVGIMFITIGVVVPVAMALSGTLSDRFGRRAVLMVLCTLIGAGIGTFYNASGWAVPFAWAFMMAPFAGVDVLFGAIGAELFPTTYRSTASGARALIMTVAGALGLFVEGYLFESAGSHAQAIVWMLPVALLSPLVLAFFVRETAGTELEDYAGEIA